MIEFKQNGRLIQVDLNPGVYLFPKESADGKTFLGILLRRLGEAGHRVNSFTYSDKTLTGVTSVLDSSKYDLILIDRYDMYFGDGLSEIQEFAKTGVVLVDCKSHKFPFRTRPCMLVMESNRLVVLG